jgi:hypothetical protein
VGAPPISPNSAERTKKWSAALTPLAELVDERNSNVALQVRIPEFIEPIFRNVAAAHGGVCTRTELLERAYVCPILRLSLTMKDRKMLTRASKGMANGMLLSTPSRGDKNAMDRFETGRERTGATELLLLAPVAPKISETADSSRTARKTTPHTATSTKESMSMLSFTSQWPDGVNGLLELQGRK